MNVVVDLLSGEAFGSFCACVFYVAALRFGFILFFGPLLGAPVFLSHVCIYVTGVRGSV